MSTRQTLIAMLAATAFTTVTPNARAMLCFSESAPSFTFGAYEPQNFEHHDVQTIFTVYCVPAYRGESLNVAIRLNSSSTNPLQMQNQTTGERLQFAMYSDPARSQPIDAVNSINLNFTLMAPTVLSIPVYGRIPAGQNVAVGNYHLPLSVIITY